MEQLDGNAIGGLLSDIFGREMTADLGQCDSCEQVTVVGEMVTYVGGPGTVARCPSCDAVLAVIVNRGEMACVDLSGLRSLAPPV